MMISAQRSVDDGRAMVPAVPFASVHTRAVYSCCVTHVLGWHAWGTPLETYNGGAPE